MRKAIVIVSIIFLLVPTIVIFVDSAFSTTSKFLKISSKHSWSISEDQAISSESFLSDLQFNARDHVGLGEDSDDNELTGEGVTVAILDTGIFANHSVFTNNGTSNWDERILAFYDEKIDEEGELPYDVYWHGTWAASILGGNSSEYQGVAPKAKFVIMKIFDYLEGELTSNISAIEKAVDWIVDNKDKYDIKIVSMSFGAKPEDDNLEDLKYLQDIVQSLIDEDILVVAAAGNYGDPTDKNEKGGTITSPASGKSVLAVGGVDYDGEIYSKSGQGPTFEGVIKPDVCAPAVDVIGATPDTLFNRYETHTGTSAATPFVSGLAALMLEKDNELSALELKNIISLTSYRTIDPRTIKDNTEGWGIIQGYAALDALEEPELLDQNYEIEVSLDDSFSVFCQPITLKPNHYFFELKSLDSAEAEMYLFDATPDEYGEPILGSTSINALSAVDPTQRMGVFTLNTRQYFLVVKLVYGTGEGDFLIKITFDYRLLSVIALAVINLFALIYVVKQIRKSKKSQNEVIK